MVHLSAGMEGNMGALFCGGSWNKDSGMLRARYGGLEKSGARNLDPRILGLPYNKDTIRYP